jgi:hypothetical protein
VFDIDFFDGSQARRFVMAALDRLSKKTDEDSLKNRLSDHRLVYEQAAAGFVSGLEQATVSDGARFAGYAPVL